MLIPVKVAASLAYIDQPFGLCWVEGPRVQLKSRRRVQWWLNGIPVLAAIACDPMLPTRRANNGGRLVVGMALQTSNSSIDLDLLPDLAFIVTDIHARLQLQHHDLSQQQRNGQFCQYTSPNPPNSSITQRANDNLHRNQGNRKQCRDRG